MITHAELEFHNVAELTRDEALPGLRLQRLPESLRLALNPLARDVALNPTHCEIRYVSAAPAVQLTLHSEIHHEYVRILQGDFLREEICLNPGETRTLTLKRDQRLLDQAASLRPSDGRGFSPEVMRLRLSGTGRVRFIAVAAEGHALRPPVAAEKPAITLLSYGSSITQGFSSLHLGATHLSLIAHQFGFDLLNLGFGGSCHAEPELVTYLAQRSDWQIGWLELGANMISAKPAISDDEFRSRARFAIDAWSADGRRPVLVPTLYRGTHDLPAAGRAGEPWRQIVREIVQSLGRSNVHLLEGPQLLEWRGLSADLCHPTDAGHAHMAAGAIAALAKVLPALPAGSPLRV